MPFVPFASAVVAGYPATVLARILRSAIEEGVLEGVHSADRVLGVVADIERAGAAWRAVQAAQALTPISATGTDDGNSATPVGAGAASSQVMEIFEAAQLLDIGERRVRQLAPAMGTKVGGRWLLDRGLVEAEARRRQDAA